MILQKSYLTSDQALQRRSARPGVVMAESDEGEPGHHTRVSSFVTWGLVFIVMVCVTGFIGFAVARLYLDDPVGDGRAAPLLVDGDKLVQLHEQTLGEIQSCQCIGRLR
jgi:hypothetical protein